MATAVSVEGREYSETYVGDTSLFTWEGLLNNEAGDAVAYGAHADRSVQVIGTFGSATVTIQGSNDGTNWATLTGPDGSDLAFTAAGLKAITEATLYIRPSVAGGGGTTDVDVLVFARRA